MTPSSSSNSAPGAAPGLSGSDLLLWSALPDLTLNIAQTATLCGVSVRQLGYWTKQGYVTATGRGTRRLYGPDSLRRILAIRQAMQNGLSLRQALRAIESSPSPSLPWPGDAAFARTVNESLAPGHDAEVTANLLALFERNPHTRDSAAGLAAKLGRTTDDVRASAEHLAAQGEVIRTPAGGETIYTRTERSSS